jgi:cell division protein FtsN
MSSRDYKRRRRGSEPFSGWTGLLLGVIAGLAGGVAIYMYMTRRPVPPPAVETPAPASARETEAPPAPETRYDFYSMLPNFEVVVPEKDREVKRDAPTTEVNKEGAYVLQVGSYKDFKEADRVRAQLALQGIESKVQRVSVDNDTWHRVRIGPITDLKELNRIRERLREAEMDVLVIRVAG